MLMTDSPCQLSSSPCQTPSKPLPVARSLPAQARETVRIGYQKSSTLITLLKTQGTLDKTLAENNIDVT
jgi:hypothetical protein